MGNVKQRNEVIEAEVANKKKKVNVIPFLEEKVYAVALNVEDTHVGWKKEIWGMRR